MTVSVSRATPADLPAVLPLFAGYQRFYANRARDDDHNRRFLARFVEPSDDGRLLVARDVGGGVVGFANLYWTFSSISATEQVHLNDLFVVDHARGRGVGRALIDASAAEARDRGGATLTWLTALDNRTAQALYERTGAARSAWFEYELDVG